MASAYTVADLIHRERVAHGFELVQSHFPGWKFQAADTIADAGLHGALLLGEPQAVTKLGPDLIASLARFSLTLSCNGVMRETGLGSNVLGHYGHGDGGTSVNNN